MCLTLPETHLPNAFDLFAFVPYLALKAAGSAFRSAKHAFAALTVAVCCAWAAACAVCETHLPKAFAPFLPVPYLALKAAGSAARSARHVDAALAWFCPFCCASFASPPAVMPAAVVPKVTI